jgi:hypothetical protein
LALQIKYRERQTKTEVKLVWVALCPVEIQTVDDRSELSTRTDEWGLHSSELPQLYLQPWMKEEKGIRHRGKGASFAAQK